MKRILVIFCSLVLVSIITFNVVKKYNDAKDDYTIKDTNMLSMMLETAIGSNEYVEAKENEWPSEEYTFNSELSTCENGSKLSWNGITKRGAINGNISDKCYVYFDKTKKTLASYIKNLYTGTQGENNLYLHDSTLDNGAEDNSYRYAGSSETTNNFVCFGYDSTDGECPTDNLYRIIGVFGDNVKLIKYDYANSNLLGKDGDYYNLIIPESSYKGELTLLDGFYWNFNANTTINEGFGSNEWSTSLLNKTNLNTNFINNIGLSWAKKIMVTDWKTGGNTWENIVGSEVKIVYKNEIAMPETNIFESAKIGLMYVSDYMYAASQNYWGLVGISADATKDYRAAVDSNWLYMGYHDWSITPQTGYAYYVFFVTSDGNVGHTTASDTRGVRPVFMLNSSVAYVSGNGTKNLPYIIY